MFSILLDAQESLLRAVVPRSSYIEHYRNSSANRYPVMSIDPSLVAMTTSFQCRFASFNVTLMTLTSTV